MQAPVSDLPTSQTANIYVLITAAGSGSRFSEERPKQYWKIGEKTILRHSIEPFLNLIEPERIRVIIGADHLELYQNSVKGLDIATPVIGSKSRKKSIFNGLKSFPNIQYEDIILIHDAARPMVHAQDIQNLIDHMKACKTIEAATLSHKVVDTLAYVGDDEKYDSYPDRAHFKMIQTPQAFRYATIREAHEKFMDKDSFTDDTSLVRALGKEVDYIDGRKDNFKITTQDDFKMAEQILNNPSTASQTRRITRSGIGFDVHAFDEKPAQLLRIGGIDIPFTRKLKGHSDADVALHTITDALLGAIAAGDIGDHFPPSDNAYKDMDSAIFLRKAAEIVRARGGEIINIDLSIICEEPKIGPYKKNIQTRIAEILDISPSQICVKATTTERLGFTGRKEGIAAQAIANIEIDR